MSQPRALNFRAAELDDVVAISGGEIGIDEGMKLAELGDEAVGGDFDEAGHDDDGEFLGDFDECGGGWPIGDGFGQGGELIAGEGLQEGVAGDAAFVEADDLCALVGGFAGEGPDAGEVVGFVGVFVLELCSGNADVLHGESLRV
jgi:hypothetical protein